MVQLQYQKLIGYHFNNFSDGVKSWRQQTEMEEIMMENDNRKFSFKVWLVRKVIK